MTVVVDTVFTSLGLSAYTGTQTFSLLTSEAPDFAGIASRLIGAAPVIIPAPAARGGGGFESIVPPVVDGPTSIIGVETATHFAIATIDTLLVSAPLAASVIYAPGSTFSTNEFDLFFPAPV